MIEIVRVFYSEVVGVKEWARDFYESKTWKNTRAAFLTSRRWVCERCKEKGIYGAAVIAHHKKHLTKQNINEPEITLAWSNLEALCQDCHNKVHHTKESGRRYSIDEQGNAIAPMRAGTTGDGEPRGGEANYSGKFLIGGVRVRAR